jgi:membrane-associated phospholipid phosphatase
VHGNRCLESGSMPFHRDTPPIWAPWHRRRPGCLRPSETVWAAGGAIALTRIVLLAHWTSDVVAGLAVGAAVERLLRFVTGFERR